MTNYYNENAEQFIQDTLNVNMGNLYKRFLPRLPEKGVILDAGCGSGRDSKHFINQGFTVHAFDASEVLAKKASKVINQKVEVTTFQEFNSNHYYDGIWACASLLHVPSAELQECIINLVNHLKTGGFFYASFKYGDTEREVNGRLFTDMKEESFSKLIEEIKSLSLVEYWITGDNRAGRENEKWFNVILAKD